MLGWVQQRIWIWTADVAPAFRGGELTAVGAATGSAVSVPTQSKLAAGPGAGHPAAGVASISVLVCIFVYASGSRFL